MKRKKFSTVLSPDDVLDVMLEIKNRKIIKFALNYRALIKGEWKEVYRVDNFHGFLHEQRFWRTKKPIPLKEEEHIPLNIVVDKYIDEIVMNFKKYKSYYEGVKKK